MQSNKTGKTAESDVYACIVVMCASLKKKTRLLAAHGRGLCGDTNATACRPVEEHVIGTKT
jgi:hypothetical protein